MPNISKTITLTSLGSNAGPTFDAYYSLDCANYTQSIDGNGISLPYVGATATITIPDNTLCIKLVNLSSGCFFNEYVEILPTTTTLTPTTLVPTTLVPTTLVPTTLVPTTLVPTTLVPTTLVPTTITPTDVPTTTITPTDTPTTSTTTATPTVTPTDAPTTLTPTTLSPCVTSVSFDVESAGEVRYVDCCGNTIYLEVGTGFQVINDCIQRDSVFATGATISNITYGLTSCTCVTTTLVPTTTLTPTETPTTITPTVTPTATPTTSTTTATPTVTPTTITPTVTPTVAPTTIATTQTPTVTPTATPTTLTPTTTTLTPTVTPTATPTVTPTATPTVSPTTIATTQTPTVTPTATPTTLTPTTTSTTTATPTVTPTVTPTATPTVTPTTTIAPPPCVISVSFEVEEAGDVRYVTCCGDTIYQFFGIGPQVINDCMEYNSFFAVGASINFVTYNLTACTCVTTTLTPTVTPTVTPTATPTVTPTDTPTTVTPTDTPTTTIAPAECICYCYTYTTTPSENVRWRNCFDGLVYTESWSYIETVDNGDGTYTACLCVDQSSTYSTPICVDGGVEVLCPGFWVAGGSCTLAGNCFYFGQ